MRAFRILGWLLAAIVFLVLLLVAVLYWLTGTDSGFSALGLQIDRRIDAISIEDPQGNLSSGVSASRISFASPQASVEVSGLNSAWQFSCVLQRRICLEDVTIDKLVVISSGEPSPGDEPETVRTEDFKIPEIVLPVDILVDNVLLRELQVQLSPDSPPYRFQNVHLSAQTDGSLIEINDASLRYANFNASLNGTIDLHGEIPVLLALDIDTQDALPDDLPDGNGDQALLVSIRLSDTLENLTINTQVSGTVEASMTAVVNPLQRKLPVTATLVSDTLGWPLVTRSQLEASDTTIEIDGDLDNYALNLQTSITGEQIPGADIAIRGSANPQRLNLSSISADTGRGRIDGDVLVMPGELTRWDARMRLSGIDPSVQWEAWPGSMDGVVSANGALQGEQWSLNIKQASLEGTLRGYPFDVKASGFKGLNNALYINQLTLNSQDNRIVASGSVHERWDLQSSVALENLAGLLPDLQGDANVELSINGELTAPTVVLNGQSERLSFKDYQFDGIRVNGDIQRGAIDPSSLVVRVDQASLANQDIEEAALLLSGNRDNHLLQVAVDGGSDQELALSLTGTLKESFDWSASLEQALIRLPGHAISLQSPAQLGWQHSERNAYVEPHCWQHQESTLCLNSPVKTANPSPAELALSSYQLASLDDLLPDGQRLKGKLDVNASLHWGETAVGGRQADISGTVSGATLSTVDAMSNPVSFSFDTLTASARLDPALIDAEFEARSRSLGTTDISVQLKPDDPDLPMTGRLNIDNLKVDILKSLVPDFEEISGEISASGRLGGRLTAPRLNGSLTLNEPRVRHKSLPFPITGGKLTAGFAGQTLTLDGKIRSEDGLIGVTGSGSIKPEQWYAKARIISEGVHIQQDPIKDAIVNHDIDISLNSKVISIRGNLGVPMAVIDIEEIPEGAETVSADVIVIEDEAEQSTTATDANPINLNVNLNIGLGEEVQLSAYGLDARLEGDLDLLLRGSNPLQLGGEISVVDGIYKQYGQDLAASGQILFVGPVNNSRLAIDAVRQIDNEDRTAGVRIQGTVSKPEVTLFTDPADKSQDAILSYIVLGRDINEASDQDANLLATAALALTVKGSRNVAGGIASALGVKDFSLETKGSGDDTELVVSGRLSDRLLLRYGRGVFGAQDTLYLRYDLTQKLYLEAAQGAEQAVDLFYSFSF